MKKDHLAKHEYPNWHEIKDLVMIYNEREWDDAEVVVWDYKHKEYRRLVFCGSTRPNEETETVGQINFVLSDLDYNPKEK